MSEHEKVTVSPCHGSPVVVVESATRHTSPYRPTESQDVGLPESPQKRASCVTSISSERHKMAAKKLSSNIKRRDSASPVTVSMATKETETKMEEIVMMTASTMPKLPSADLPSPIPSTHKEYTMPIVEPPKKVPDDESITSEVAEYTRESRFKAPYWEIDNNSDKKKEVAVDEEFKEGVDAKEIEENAVLEDKGVEKHKKVAEKEEVESGSDEVASSITSSEEADELGEEAEEVEEEEVVSLQGSEEETFAEVTLTEQSSLCSLEETTLPGPCSSTGMPFAGSSEAMISLTKKPGSKASVGHDSFKPICSGISITMKGSGRNAAYMRPMDLTVAKAKISPLSVGQGDVRLKVKDGFSHYLFGLRGKLLTLGGKINHALHF